MAYEQKVEHIECLNVFARINISGRLECCAELMQGAPNKEHWVEVTAPESQQFLDEVNEVFGTEFKMEQFK